VSGAPAPAGSSGVWRRAVRIAAFAIGLPYAFALSREVGKASGNPPVDGMAWAVGVLGVIFLLRGLATELTRGPEANLQKDLQWGVAIGCAFTVLSLAGVIGG
jgi:hypothetical protein